MREPIEMESNTIQPNIQPIIPSPASPRPSVGVEQVGKSFQESLEALTNTEHDSDNLFVQMATGENVDIHQAVIAAEETDINFRVALAIRDRLVDAYREVMRMNV